MSTINSTRFEQICDGVWRDRDTILSGRGILSNEVAMLRAVYWRLCNAGVGQGQSVRDCDEEQMLTVYPRLVVSILTQKADPPFDGAPYLEELVNRSLEEGREEYVN